MLRQGTFDPSRVFAQDRLQHRAHLPEEQFLRLDEAL